MKKLFILMFCLSLPMQLFAEIITLKSGQIVEGKIIERNDKFVRIEISGTPVTYYWEEIKNIEDKLEVIVVNEPPKTSKTSASRSGSTEQEKSVGPVDSTKQEKKELSAWDKWYANAQPYIQRVKQILGDANTETTSIWEQIKITKNRNQKRILIQLMGNKLIPYIQTLQNLQPPRGLERWHQLQIQAIEQLRLVTDAEAKGNPSIAQNYANQLSIIQANASQELRSVLIEHKAPLEVINGLAANK